MHTLSGKKQLAIGILIAALLVVIGIVKGYYKSPSEDITPRAPETTAQTIKTVSTDQRIQEKRDAVRREKAQAAIKEHEAIMEQDPRAEDTPDRMMAIGNLYQYQMGDRYSAITSYRNLVDHFPDNTKTPQAYIEIAHCYEQLGDEEQARFVYQEMVDKLDPTLQHTLYAKQMLEK